MDATRESHHRERMQRKKAVIDARIAEATMDKGLLLVLTGNGKVKSSSPSAWWPAPSATACAWVPTRIRRIA